MTSRARKLKAEQLTVLNAEEDNPKLLDLLEIATSSARKTIFINALIDIFPTAFACFDKTPEQRFDIFTAWFGNYNQINTFYSGIKAALYHRQQYFLETCFMKRQFISDIGLDWTADAKSPFFSKVNSACGVVGESSFLS